MKNEFKIRNAISKAEGLPFNLVKAITDYPFKFAKEKMTDPIEERPVRIRYFGAFTQKPIHTKNYGANMRVHVLKEYIEETTIMMATVLHFVVPTFDSAIRILDDALASKDYEKIDIIWNEWKKFHYREKNK